MTTPAVTVAVPVKDRRAQMLRCLEALLAQSHPSYEVLVLDNGSTDGTVEAVLERASSAPEVPVRVEVLPGLSVGRMRLSAVDHSRAEVIAYTDSDCLPTPGWLSAITSPFALDPRCGVVQGRTLPEGPVTAPWPHTQQLVGFTGRYEACNIAYRREALADARPLAEPFGWFYEDTAVGLAARRAGWTAAYREDALVHHDVTYPGFGYHARRVRGNRSVPRIVRVFPEARADLLHLRYFVAERDVRFTAFGLAVLAAAHPRTRRIAPLLALPYAKYVLTHGRGRDLRPVTDPRAVAQALVYDTARLSALIPASIRERRLVL